MGIVQVTIAQIPSNLLFVTDMQQQDGAARRVLLAGQHRR